VKVVIDTNVLLSSLPVTSESHLIFLSLIQDRFKLCITSDILNEYEEVFQQRANSAVAEYALDLFDILPNIILVKKYYFWQLIQSDPDDNKFVDCAIASNADYIITDDKHFKVLASIGFPKVNVLSKQEFLTLLST